MNEFRQYLEDSLSRDYCDARIEFHYKFMSSPIHWKHDLIFSTRLGMDFFKETIIAFDSIPEGEMDALAILRRSGITDDPQFIDKMEWDWANLILKWKISDKS